MAKKLRGECEVKLGRETFTLRLALGDLEELENLLGIGVVELATSFTGGKAKLSQAVAVIRQGFIGAGLKKSDAQVRKLIEDTGIGIMSAAATLLLSVFVDDDEGNAGAAGKGKD